MSFSAIKYESKILESLASMLNLNEKTDNEILDEIKDENTSITFEIDDDIKKLIDINKINCTCDESKKKIDEYKGKKFEYFYNIETYGVDFFLDICNALCRSNYKHFLTEEGKNEVIKGLKIRRNSNLYKYVSFFLSKERLNKERLSDKKCPEHIYHCFRCLKSVLHIYNDDQNNDTKNMYLNQNKYITEEIEERIENDILNSNDTFKSQQNHQDGIISVFKYKSELSSITRKSNQKIVQTIFEHTKDFNTKENKLPFIKDTKLKGSNMHNTVNTDSTTNSIPSNDFYLNNSIMSNSNFNNSIISNSNFNNSIMSNSNFNNSIISNSNFNNSVMSNSNFNNTVMSNSNFTNVYSMENNNPEISIQEDNEKYIPNTNEPKTKRFSLRSRQFSGKKEPSNKYKNLNKKVKLNSQNKSLTRNSHRNDCNSITNYCNNKKIRKRRTFSNNRKIRNSTNSFMPDYLYLENTREQIDSIYFSNSIFKSIDKSIEKFDMIANENKFFDNDDEDSPSKFKEFPTKETEIEENIENENYKEKSEKNEPEDYNPYLESENGNILGDINNEKQILDNLSSIIINQNELNNLSNDEKCIDIINDNEGANKLIDTKIKFLHEQTNEKDLEEQLNKQNIILEESKEKNANEYGIYEKHTLSKNFCNDEEYEGNQSDDTSYSTNGSNYSKYLKRKKKLEEQGKIVIDLNLLHRNTIKPNMKQCRDEKMAERLRIEKLKKILEEKKMLLCRVEDIAKKRNRIHVKTQILSEDSKIKRIYFSHKMKKVYNYKFGYFGCGWSNNKTEWTPFIHAPFFDNQHNTIYKSRNKKLYEEIYDTILHGRIHPHIKVVELKDHMHPIRLCTPSNEDCYSVIYTGEKINATDERVIFGEYTGFVANNKELPQEKHQYIFALTFNKKVFNDRKNVVFINEIDSYENESDENENSVEGNNSEMKYANMKNGNNYKGNKFNLDEDKHNEEISKEKEKGEKNKSLGNNNKKKENKNSNINDKSKELNNLIILPDNYTYAVDSSHMFNEMSLVNHYKTCSIFNNYDFRINAEWQIVYLDGWPHIILTSIPGVEIETGEEIFADFGFEWFDRVNDICLNDFIKNNYEHRLNEIGIKSIKEKNFNGLDDIVDKYNLLKNYTTCNICMHSVNTDCNNYILCSGCNHVYHLKCVNRLNFQINENYDWFCSSCIQFSMNIISQKEFLEYIKKENNKRLINYFIEHNKNIDQGKTKSSEKILMLENNNENNLDSYNCEKNNEIQLDDENYINNFENIKKLLQCKENIDDLLNNQQIINAFLENVDNNINILQGEEGQDDNIILKNPELKNLIENSYELHLLIEYKNKIDDLLLCRENINFLLNNDQAKRTFQMRIKTINYLMQNKKCIENLVESIEKKNQGEITKNNNTTFKTSNDKLQLLMNDDAQNGNTDNTSSLDLFKCENGEQNCVALCEENDTTQSMIIPVHGKYPYSKDGCYFTSAYENMLYKKTNNIIKNLKDLKNKNRKSRFKNNSIKNEMNDENSNGTDEAGLNAYYNYMMKLSKKILGLPLIREFEKGINTHQPSLPLNANLKKLEVCSNCYKKHGNLAKAVICRVTKLHFETNYNDGLGEEELHKMSSECIQSVIKELANTIKEYRKQELNSAFIQYTKKKKQTGLINNKENDIKIGTRLSDIITPSDIINSTFNKTDIENKDFYHSLSKSLYKDTYETDDNILMQHSHISYIDKNKSVNNSFESHQDENSTLQINTYTTLGKKYENIGDGNGKNCHQANLSSDTIDEKNVSDQENGKNNKRISYKNGNISAYNNDINNVCFRSENGDSNNNDYKNQKKNKFKNDNELLTTNEILLDDKKKEDKSISNNNLNINNFIPLFGIELGKTKFQREFTNGTYVGTVTKQIKDDNDNNFFVVTYEDGDVEWITPFFLFQELLKQATNNIEYPLATPFKDLMNPSFKKDIKLNNYSLELKVEKKKKKGAGEYNSNNNSTTKRQRHNQEDNSSKTKKRYSAKQ
ncbi:histone-lysine N-methyltransferase, H3 lysine-4 specific, putative [Plasmodium chabaudi adami]|uniref:Histone-lysine N-methyltransferase, H3 lysine-4 specific, putative n=1 Tax=Plasmodium chabaudi adami TaxID=5826 RepID=A0A1C6YPP3_PLACE|nr:histone-lysine N-methyltransferase, H3 lysine-4 specific, putative [Plasmodium chabaudi adami]